MAKKRRSIAPNEPLRHPDHPRPVTRRDFMRQGFLGASAAVTGISPLLAMLLNPRLARADVFNPLDQDIRDMASAAGCTIGVGGNGKIPFIAFDLAGGANIAGSNVLVGGTNGPLIDPLTTQGYSKLGIASDSVPLPGSTFVDNSLGLPFHSQSAMLAGIKSTLGTAPLGKINGFVIPAVSDNDTNTNPHNPMYGIARAGIDPTTSMPGYGAKGSLLSLIGSVASVSGGNSMAPAGLIDPTLQPTKIASPSDDIGLVSGGNMTSLMSAEDIVTSAQATARISQAAITNQNISGTKQPITSDSDLQHNLTCAYTKTADNLNKFVTGPSALDPTDTVNNPGNPIPGIFAPVGGISGTAFNRTASVMKLVVDGYAGAGTITLGGYDYHTGDRTTGDQRDILAGQCIGACLAYADAVQKPLMIYVFSDGSLFSNGSAEGQATVNVNGTIVATGGKGVWTGDNSSTAAAFALVYNPTGAPQLMPGRNGNSQIGAFKDSGSVQTGFRTANGFTVNASNNVTALVYTLLLNYMALHGQSSSFNSVFPNANLGGTSSALLDDLTAFQPIVNGQMT